MGFFSFPLFNLGSGRALLVIIPWRKDDSLKILAIYAPNDPQTNQYFWDHVHSKLRGLPKPDIMLGDFNLKTKRIQFTFAQSAHQGGRQSRIDRIYIKDELHQLISLFILKNKKLGEDVIEQ